ncbi:tRNA (adenosine(37)-N6)-threonylcarbamoyltransferase complex dimerization subunit type 1 TsaB [Candidatus Peregrinibacteria bacterium]|nr:tRNA (adenosine(37)-N6)-threonylcarbamoyltransferase complex dimerization subunit type 1 TsaB [Candidatus Peregrinibacteria bacterium]
MRILFIDVASHDGLIALCTEEAIIALKNVDHRIQDDELVTFFEEILKKTKWKPETLTHIACVIGPGGFTSLRVGVAFANALSWALEIPIVGIHLSDIYRERQAVSSKKEANFLWLHSTKKHELFVRGFGSYQKNWPKPIHVRLEEVPNDICWVGELLPEHIQKGWLNVPLKDIRDVLPGFLSHQHYTNQTVAAWYGREG